MAIRISGLSSGLDTESIVQQLVSAYSVKKDNYVKAQTKLSWKQDAWKSLNTKIYSLYGNISNMRYSSAYNLKATSVSDSTKATITAGDTAINGTQTLNISKLAKAGYLTGGKLASGTTENSTLESLGYTGGNGTISVTSGGKTTDIAVNGDTTVKDFVAKLNSAGVKSSYDATNNRIFVTAAESGAENDFSIAGAGSTGTEALTALGLNVASTATKDAYTDWGMYAKDVNGNDYYYYENGELKTSDAAYSEENTQTAIQEKLDEVAAAKAEIASLTAANTTAKANVTTATAQQKYAKAYDAVNTQFANDVAWTDSQKKDIQTLSGMTSAELSKKYETDADGNFKYDDEGKLIEATADSEHSSTGSARLTKIGEDTGLVTSTTDAAGKVTTNKTALDSMVANLKTVSAYESNTDNADTVTAVHEAYEAGTLNTEDGLIASYQNTITTNNAAITANTATIAEDNATISKYSLISNNSTAATLTGRVTYALQSLEQIKNGTYQDSAGASRVNGQDSVIELNGATFTSSSNSYSINGLTIEALAETNGSEITVTTKTDTQGLYDQVKGFIKQYNELINEMTSLYNAGSAKGYEPLTTEEKDSMTDTQIEEWEKKIKDSLLRRDDTLDGVMSVMQNAMSSSFTINGKSYSLSSFGISTLGVLNASDNQQNAYHIAGDADDTATKANKDKLMAAIQNDPDTIADFMKQLTSELYTKLDGKMKSTTLSSAYTVYNDKQMSKEYSDYTTTISDWEEKVSNIEDSYYKKFAAMESALATLQSNASSLSSLLG